MARASKKAAVAKVPVRLYWVSTADHDEDWFIFAKSKQSAAKFHKDYEGYGPGETTAEPILQARDIAGPFPRHAQIDDLAALGFEILKGGDPGRSVKYWDRTFVEGHLESLIAEIDDDNSEAVGGGRPRGTKPSSLKSNLNWTPLLWNGAAEAATVTPNHHIVAIAILAATYAGLSDGPRISLNPVPGAP